VFEAAAEFVSLAAGVAFRVAAALDDEDTEPGTPFATASPIMTGEPMASALLPSAAVLLWVPEGAA
jgi:hypothetical protein